MVFPARFQIVVKLIVINVPLQVVNWKKRSPPKVNLKSALEVGLTKYFFISSGTHQIQSQHNERSILSIFKPRLAPVAAENEHLGQKWLP
jgi:hypothetical protein